MQATSNSTSQSVAPSLNPLTPKDPYSGRTAPLTSKRFTLYIYSTNIGTEYIKHSIYSPFFPLQNAVCFIILTYLVPVLFTFYIQSVLKLKKYNSGAKRLIHFIFQLSFSHIQKLKVSKTKVIFTPKLANKALWASIIMALPFLEPRRYMGWMVRATSRPL